MVENIFRHLAHYDPHTRGQRASGRLARILGAAVEVDKAILFSVLITIAAFIPLFAMQGVEGQIFSPMARTYAYALLGAVIATFTVTPVMASILLPAKVEEVETLPGPLASQRLSAVAAGGREAWLALGDDRGRLSPDHVASGDAARHGIPAEARGRQHVDPRVDAADHRA